MRLRLRGRPAYWGLAIGTLGGLLDTWLMLALGIDLSVAGRDMTLPVALYLALNFALLCGAVGYFIDARARA